jgi:ribosome-associated heat shock protein Hsp15
VEVTRVDRWLWAVRIEKTRTAATDACRGGHVSVNRNPAKPATLVRPGDRVTVTLPGRIRELEVVQIIEKRVAASVAAGCLIDHSPPPSPGPASGPVFARDPSTGRPTKRDRRRLDQLRRRPG